MRFENRRAVILCTLAIKTFKTFKYSFDAILILSLIRDINMSEIQIADGKKGEFFSSLRNLLRTYDLSYIREGEREESKRVR